MKIMKISVFRISSRPISHLTVQMLSFRQYKI